MIYSSDFPSGYNAGSAFYRWIEVNCQWNRDLRLVAGSGTANAATALEDNKIKLHCERNCKRVGVYMASEDSSRDRFTDRD